MPSNFADLYKPVKDLLTKKFNGDSHKIDLKAKDVVTFNPVFTRNAAGAVSATAAVEGNYSPCDWCLLKLKYTIGTNGHLKTNVKAEKLAPDFILEGNWDAALGDNLSKDTYDLIAKYSSKSINAEAKVAKGKALIGDFSAVYAALPDLNLGASLVYDLGSVSQNSIGLGASYAPSAKTSVSTTLQRDITSTGITDTLKAGFVTKGSPYTVGGEYSTTLQDPKKSVITVGIETALEGGQILKSKIDTKGGLALSLQHRLNKQVQLCSSLELAAPKDGSWASKFGTEIIYEG
uniref:Porin-like protein n=1 Tax=Euglena gracilis TaxID=3039 RepID=Q9FPM7_EUGGR|nr:porin-like protein [Euglena gracilis]